jgi:hypothetical protein
MMNPTAMCSQVETIVHRETWCWKTLKVESRRMEDVTDEGWEP